MADLEKIFNILKKNKVNIYWLLNSKDFDQYNAWWDYPLEEDEYQLLKEALQ